MVENRRHKRAPVDFAVEFWSRGSVDRRRGNAKDLSQGGMFIETSEPLPFASDVMVKFHLTERGALPELRAVVRWHHAGGMGVQFGLLGARETNAIAELTKGK